MSSPPTVPAGTQQAELGVLLAGAVRAVADAQDVLDEHARERVAAYLAAPAGSLALPPLWYAFDSVSVDLELSSEAVRTGSTGQTRLLCRTLNPLTVGLYGYSAAVGTRVRVSLAPQRLAPQPLASPPTPPTPSGGGPTSPT